MLEDAGIVVVAEVDDGAAALDAIETLAPDIAILDLDMPKMDGVAVAHAVTAGRLDVKVIIMTAHKSQALVQKVLDAGPLGFILKDDAVTDVVTCVRAVHAGRPYVSPLVSTSTRPRRQSASTLTAEHPGLATLSPAERRILGLVALGHTSRDIAAALSVSVRTVEHHRASITDKLGLAGSNALVRFAAAHRDTLG